MSRESVKKDCLAKCVKKECLDGWGGAGAALVDDSASHLRKQERFECYASIQSDCVRVRGFYQVSFLRERCCKENWQGDSHESTIDGAGGSTVFLESGLRKGKGIKGHGISLLTCATRFDWRAPSPKIFNIGHYRRFGRKKHWIPWLIATRGADKQCRANKHDVLQRVSTFCQPLDVASCFGHLLEMS